MASRFLIIRFSSFGDIIQCLSVPQAILEKWPDAEIHFVTRRDFSDLLKLCPNIHQIHLFDKKTGFWGLIQFARNLAQHDWDYIYDAHNNLRSRILCLFLSSSNFVRRSKNRIKRFLEFKLRIRQFKQPYIGQLSFLEPIKKWGIEVKVAKTPPLFVAPELISKTLSQYNLKKPYVTLMPSAAWVMKRWPISHWKNLLQLLENKNIVLLGGPDDRFIDDLITPYQRNVINLSGKLGLLESSYVVAGSEKLVSADTGVLHVADQLGVPLLALIGPTAFGYPGRPTSHTLEVQLDCKPCTKDGRGKCRNSVYQKCMVDILPEQVAKEVLQ